MRRTLFLALALMLGFGLVACDDEGPAEKAGEQVDEAVEDTGQAIEDAGDEMEETTDNMNDGG